MDNVIEVHIEGIKYIVFDVPIKSTYALNNMYAEIRKSKSILRGSSNVVQGGFWGTTIIILSILVPEYQAQAFSEVLLKL